MRDTVLVAAVDLHDLFHAALQREENVIELVEGRLDSLDELINVTWRRSFLQGLDAAEEPEVENIQIRTVRWLVRKFYAAAVDRARRYELCIVAKQMRCRVVLLEEYRNGFDVLGNFSRIAGKTCSRIIFFTSSRLTVAGVVTMDPLGRFLDDRKAGARCTKGQIPYFPSNPGRGLAAATMNMIFAMKRLLLHCRWDVSSSVVM